MTQYLAIRSGASGPALVGTSQDDVPLWDVAQGKWYTGPAPGGGLVDSVFGRAGNVVAVTGDYDSDQVDNVSGVPGVSVSDALDYLLANAGAVASVFGRIGVVVAASGDYDSDQVDNVSGVSGSSVSDALDALLAAIPTAITSLLFTAGPRIAMRFSGAGAAQQGTVDRGVELDATGILVSTTGPARGQENVAPDFWPPQQTQGSIATANSLTLSVPLVAATKWQRIQCDAYVDAADGTGVCIFAMSLLNVVHKLAAGTGVLIVDDQVQWSSPASGWTFTSAVDGGNANLVFTLSNTSGTTRNGSIVAQGVTQDKP